MAAAGKVAGHRWGTGNGPGDQDEPNPGTGHRMGAHQVHQDDRLPGNDLPPSVPRLPPIPGTKRAPVNLAARRHREQIANPGREECRPNYATT